MKQKFSFAKGLVRKWAAWTTKKNHEELRTVFSKIHQVMTRIVVVGLKFYTERVGLMLN